MYDRIMQRLEAAGKENERTVQELKGNAPVEVWEKKMRKKGRKGEKLEIYNSCVLYTTHSCPPTVETDNATHTKART